MRILYIDIDSLRPDHLGCYGYHRNTSPNIDALAERGICFENVYASDAPCLPSRSALWSGRCGFHTGVVNHGGMAGQPFVEGPGRGFRDLFGTTSWMSQLRELGYYTATVSTFGERHSAWHWYAGFNEIYNLGKTGNETADEVTPLALDWIERNGTKDNWFLHVNFWDPHTPYRTPLEFGDPFENDPLPDWYTEDMWRRSWEGYGPHSPQEPHDYGGERVNHLFPRTPDQIDSMEKVRQWIDGYDVGVNYADEHVGRILNSLADTGILEDTVIMVSADHGENLGELNVWGDHQTADQITCRVPLIVQWPGLTNQSRVDSALHYQFDWAATMVELLGGRVPENWDAQPFSTALREEKEHGRPYLVTSQNAWSCQRGIRFDNYICLRTYHDGYKQLDPIMLFDLENDPHEQVNLTAVRPDLVAKAMQYLADWQYQMALTSPQNVDPMMTVLREGGSFHTRGQLPKYLDHLRNTGRGHHADHLSQKHSDEIV